MSLYLNSSLSNTGVSHALYFIEMVSYCEQIKNKFGKTCKQTVRRYYWTVNILLLGGDDIMVVQGTTL